MKKIFMSLAAALICSASMAEVAVVVHPANDSAFDSKSIERIFMLRTGSFTNGDTAKPVTQPASAEITKEFGEIVLGKDVKRVKDIWNKMSFSGRAAKPEEFADDAAVLGYVSGDRHAIGFVDATKVDSRVKVVARY